MRQRGKNILIIRNSSLGDIVISLPLVNTLYQEYPQHQFIFLTKKKFKPLFEILPHIELFLLEDDKKHKGLLGLLKLYKEVKAIGIDQIADLHGVFRSQVLCFLFRIFQKVEVSLINKYRKERKSLTKKYSKTLRPLKSILDCYKEVFRKLGLEIKKDLSPPKIPTLETIEQFLSLKKDKKWIGIAPFAHYNEKTYPLDKMERIIGILNKEDVKIFVFGSGSYQENIALNWSKKFTNVISTIKEFGLLKELYIMSTLDVMIAMDSSNMHLASMVNTRVVSIWGATHPFAGFYGYNQNPADAVQLSIFCRPCSIFGEKKCWRKSMHCLNGLEERKIIDKIQQVLDIAL